MKYIKDIHQVNQKKAQQNFNNRIQKYNLYFIHVKNLFVLKNIFIFSIFFLLLLLFYPIYSELFDFIC